LLQGGEHLLGRSIRDKMAGRDEQPQRGSICPDHSLSCVRGTEMSRTKIFAILCAMLAVVAVSLTGPMGIGAPPKTAAGPKLAHMVYFKLKDGSGANRAKLVAACKLLLSGHEGVEYFSTGSLAGDLNKDFNDHDFDVSLNLVFDGKEAHDKYQESDRHKKFIEENAESIEKVRVFDSYLSPAPPAKAAAPVAESAQ
jgi:stress responsive alpha/beta barrel protein